MSLLQLLGSFPRFLIDRFNYKHKSLEDCSGEEDVKGKVAVITGGNRGLGKVVALQMARRGATVILACRDLDEAANAIQDIREQVSEDVNLILIKLDLSDMTSVEACAMEIKKKVTHVNILINNAGVMIPSIQGTADGFEKNLAVNHLGHAKLTMLLLSHLKRGSPSRIVNVISSSHIWSSLNPEDINWRSPNNKDTQLMNLAPYYDSKKVTILFSNELSRRLEKTMSSGQVNVYCVCPGACDTELFNKSHSLLNKLFVRATLALLGKTLEQGAATILYCALAQEISRESGRLYHMEARWPHGDRQNSNQILAKNIWDRTEELLGLSLQNVIDSLQ